MSYAARMNELFLTKVGSAESKDKLAEFGGSYIRDRLREVNFLGHVLPPIQVTRADLQRSVNHDTMIKIVDIEPQSRAMTATFRGQPTARIIRAARVECAFHTISSELFQKTEQELLAYEAPVTKIIEENSLKDMDEIQDREFLIHVEASVQAQQTEINTTSTSLSSLTIAGGTVVEYKIRKGEIARNVTGTPNGIVWPLQKPDIANGFKMIDGVRLRAKQILMPETQADDLLQWTLEDLGSAKVGETAIEGFKYNTLLGRNMIRTIKSDILRQGNIYFFTDASFLGRYYILNNPKFYIDKIANNIFFQSWMDIGMILANVAAMAKVELYSADANPTTDVQVLASTFRPVSEDSLGAVNNRVDSGIRFPAVTTY